MQKPAREVEGAAAGAQQHLIQLLFPVMEQWKTACAGRALPEARVKAKNKIKMRRMFDEFWARESDKSRRGGKKAERYRPLGE